MPTSSLPDIVSTPREATQVTVPGTVNETLRRNGLAPGLGLDQDMGQTLVPVHDGAGYESVEAHLHAGVQAEGIQEALQLLAVTVFQ